MKPWNWMLDHWGIVTTVVAALAGMFAKRGSSGSPLRGRFSGGWVARRWNVEKANAQLRDQIRSLLEENQEKDNSLERQRASWTREREDIERQTNALLTRNDTLVRLVDALTEAREKGLLTVSSPPPTAPTPPSGTSSRSSKTSKP